MRAFTYYLHFEFPLANTLFFLSFTFCYSWLASRMKALLILKMPPCFQLGQNNYSSLFTIIISDALAFTSSLP